VFLIFVEYGFVSIVILQFLILCYIGGQAKTLMFVQINPDVKSYSETFSTLKFAERVSGVELGAARSSKESKDIRDLMEQVLNFKYHPLPFEYFYLYCNKKIILFPFMIRHLFKLKIALPIAVISSFKMETAV